MNDEKFRCNMNLQAEGKPYPRTCARCGNGPCPNTVDYELMYKAIIAGFQEVKDMDDKEIYQEIMSASQEIDDIEPWLEALVAEQDWRKR